MKHAYLIIAHNEFEILKLLVSAIDDIRNDIYIHFDKKIEDKNLPQLNTFNAKLFVLESRVDVKWGDVSVLEAEMTLFKAAYNNGHYSYFHLLSGVDLPLKSQDYIYDFFQANKGKEFIGFSNYDYKQEVDRKINRYHLFPKDFRCYEGSVTLFKRYCRAIFLRLQFLINFRRNVEIEFRKGTQWVSVTQDFVCYALKQWPRFARIFQNTFCSDEVFLQTICWNSEFRFHIYNMDVEELGCMRKIGWNNGELIDWSIQDFEILVKSPCLFARKFNSNNIGVVNMLKKYNNSN